MTTIYTNQIDIPTIFKGILEKPWLEKKIYTRIKISIMIYDMNLIKKYYFHFNKKKIIVNTISIRYSIPKSIENIIVSYLNYDNLIKNIEKKYPRTKYYFNKN